MSETSVLVFPPTYLFSLIIQCVLLFFLVMKIKSRNCFWPDLFFLLAITINLSTFILVFCRPQTLNIQLITDPLSWILILISIVSYGYTKVR